MKRILIASFLVTAPFVLVGCGEQKVEKNNKIEHKGTIKVERKVKREKTSSGLEYEIIQEGSGVSPQTGVSPQKGQQVTVHYTGWLDKDGKPGAKFDSSVDRGQPFSFSIGVGQVIKGWDEGVLSMKIGEKRRLFIPASLGYGARGAGASIPPNAGLIFDVELLKVS